MCQRTAIARRALRAAEPPSPPPLERLPFGLDEPAADRGFEKTPKRVRCSFEPDVGKVLRAKGVDVLE
jgi:hypothetical protein